MRFIMATLTSTLTSILVFSALAFQNAEQAAGTAGQTEAAESYWDAVALVFVHTATVIGPFIFLMVVVSGAAVMILRARHPHFTWLHAVMLGCTEGAVVVGVMWFFITGGAAWRLGDYLMIFIGAAAGGTAATLFAVIMRGGLELDAARTE